jgi:hypothetical protein
MPASSEPAGARARRRQHLAASARSLAVAVAVAAARVELPRHAGAERTVLAGLGAWGDGVS